MLLSKGDSLFEPVVASVGSPSEFRFAKLPANSMQRGRFHMHNSSAKMDNDAYGKYVAQKAPKSRTLRNTIWAYIIGGIICCVGEGIFLMFEQLGFEKDNAKLLSSVSLIFLGSLLTALHVYDKIAKLAGAGTLVPITGFANSITAPAMEFKSEGLICGMGAKMFIIAGPVLAYGATASVIYGVVIWLMGLF